MHQQEVNNNKDKKPGQQYGPDNLGGNRLKYAQDGKKDTVGGGNLDLGILQVILKNNGIDKKQQ